MKHPTVDFNNMYELRGIRRIFITKTKARTDSQKSGMSKYFSTLFESTRNLKYFGTLLAMDDNNHKLKDSQLDKPFGRL